MHSPSPTSIDYEELETQIRERVAYVQFIRGDDWPPLAVVKVWCSEFKIVYDSRWSDGDCERVWQFVNKLRFDNNSQTGLGIRRGGTNEVFTGPQMKAIAALVADSFDPEELWLFMRGDLNLPEKDIPTGSTRLIVTFKLVDHFNRREKTRELINKISHARDNLRDRLHEICNPRPTNQ